MGGGATAPEAWTQGQVSFSREPLSGPVGSQSCLLLSPSLLCDSQTQQHCGSAEQDMQKAGEGGKANAPLSG